MLGESQYSARGSYDAAPRPTSSAPSPAAAAGTSVALTLRLLLVHELVVDHVFCPSHTLRLGHLPGLADTDVAWQNLPDTALPEGWRLQVPALTPRQLQALCEQGGRARPPILGLASGPHARADSRFVPVLGSAALR